MNETTIHRLCVFAGGRGEGQPALLAVAARLGRAAARAGLGVVYGGSRHGLMGVLARAALAEGGEVIGVTTPFLMQGQRPLAELHELVVVSDLAERKRALAARADAFAVLPGGLDTLDEVVEQILLSKLGLHTKPIVLLNAQRYWRPLLALIDHMSATGFPMRADAPEPLVCEDADEAIAKLLIAATRVRAPRPRNFAWLNEIDETASRHEVFFCPDREPTAANGHQP